MNNILKTKRENAGFTQVQIANKVGISERSYQRYEAGERIPDVIQAQLIARSLGTTVKAIWPEGTQT